MRAVLTNPTGLHARPASLFVQTADRFQANVRASGHGRESDASSIIGILSLGLRQGDTLTIKASGTDATAALEALSDLVRANFYETAPAGETPVSVLPDAGGRDKSPPSENASQQSGGPGRRIKTREGFAVGPPLLYTSGAISLSAVEQRTISPDKVASEQMRLREALDSAGQELRSLATSLQSRIGQ